MSPLLAATIFVVGIQGAALLFDEIYYHQKRDVGFWESWGHPLDSFFFAVPVGLTALVAPTSSNLIAYVALSILSSLLITKDEGIHTSHCQAGEHWLHALLFVLHPSVLFCVGLLWVSGEGGWFRQTLPLAILGFTMYQIFFAVKQMARGSYRVRNQ